MTCELHVLSIFKLRQRLSTRRRRRCLDSCNHQTEEIQLVPGPWSRVRRRVRSWVLRPMGTCQSKCVLQQFYFLSLSLSLYLFFFVLWPIWVTRIVVVVFFFSIVVAGSVTRFYFSVFPLPFKSMSNLSFECKATTTTTKTINFIFNFCCYFCEFNVVKTTKTKTTVW